MLPYYTPQVIDNHWHPPANKVIMPHTYDIAKRALLGMTLNGENQAILISGESGAGKTECAKQCFSFLAEVTQLCRNNNVDNSYSETKFVDANVTLCVCSNISCCS